MNDEDLPIIILESPLAHGSAVADGLRELDQQQLKKMADKTIQALLDDHQVRVYCMLVTPPNTLPRAVKSGRREIGNVLCRKQFELGNLPSVFVKLAPGRTVLNLPVGDDPIGGVWSASASYERHRVLAGQPPQLSGYDRRSSVVDERTSANLSQFNSIVGLLQFRVQKHPDELAYCTIDAKGREGKVSRGAS